jgi:succinate dehydrogenase / fumarate reductase membrane anchor subunit
MRVFLGQRAWLLQRATALVLLILLLLGALRLWTEGPLSYARWHELATSTHGAVLIAVFFAALCLHAWVGVRDILLDYVHPPALRLALLALAGVVLLAVQTRVVLVLAAGFAG